MIHFKPQKAHTAPGLTFCAPYDYLFDMTDAGGAAVFVREYTLASGGPCCDCGYKKKRG